MVIDMCHPNGQMLLIIFDATIVAGCTSILHFFYVFGKSAQTTIA